MITNTQTKKIKELIETNQNIILFHHVNPDGDCMASSFGLAEALRDKYPNKNIKVVADIKDYTPHLRYMDEYINWEKTIKEPEYNDYLAIISDTSVEARVRFYENFKDNIKSTIVYDHHQNELSLDNVNVFWKESNYPAAALMTYELLNSLKIEISPKAALIINHGILTDTEMYRLAPGNGKAISISAKLNDIIGVEEQTKLYSKMFEKTEDEIKYEAWVFSNFKIVENKVAYIKVTKDIIDKFNLEPDQAAKVELLQGIKGIEAWLFFTEYPNFIRTEFRSNNIWINKIAAEFGGGGHKLRAGCKLNSMEEYKSVVERVVEETKK